jgi:two-component system chemotaxis response regulator CheB
MSLLDGKIILRFGPKINHSRPAIDPLFYSAALFYGPLAIGIILSGLLDDGAAGLLAIKKCHGITIVQKPEDAEFPSMPENALKITKVDYSVPISLMGQVIKDIVKKEYKELFNKERWELLEIESKLNFIESRYGESDISKIANPSKYSCPACHGVLWKIKDEQLPRYRCRVGHAYSERSLIYELEKNIENYLWMLLRAYEEKQQIMLASFKDDSTSAKENQSIENILEIIKKLLN